MAKNKVDGVYSDDPARNPLAVKFDTLAYKQALEMNLRVMDATAMALCMENQLPIVVFNLQEHGNIMRVVMGEPVGTNVGVYLRDDRTTDHRRHNLVVRPPSSIVGPKEN